MALDPNQTTKEFALRTLLLYLAWHSDDFTEKWLKDALEAKFKSEGTSEKYKNATAVAFLRSNASRDSITDLYEPIRDILVERLNTNGENIKWTEFIRPYYELVFGRMTEDKSPFHLSEYGIRSALNLQRPDLDKATDLVGGFWHVIRPDSELGYAELIDELQSIVDGQAQVENSNLMFNCGLLTIKPVQYSPGELPTFKFESQFNKSRNMRFDGYMYPLNSELIFQGAMSRENNNKIGQFTWLYSGESEQPDGHGGLMIARNRSGESIATMAIFVKTLPTDEEKKSVQNKEKSQADIDTELYDLMAARLKDDIKKTRLKKLIERKILDEKDISRMLELYKDRVVYST